MIAKIGKMMTKKEDKSFSYEELAAMLKKESTLWML